MTKPDPQALLACYRSGQMSHAQAVAHIESGDFSLDEVPTKAAARIIVEPTNTPTVAVVRIIQEPTEGDAA